MLNLSVWLVQITKKFTQTFFFSVNLNGCIYWIKKSEVGNHSWGRPKGSFFNCYYTEMHGRVLLLSLDWSILLLICILYCWVLSKYHFFEFWGMNLFGIEPWSFGPLTNTLPTSQWAGTYRIIPQNDLNR